MMSHEERLELINRPIKLFRGNTYGGRSHGGSEGYTRKEDGTPDMSNKALEQITLRRLMRGKKPSLSDYEGG